MTLFDWFSKIFTKEELRQPVPSYRFGDFTSEELFILYYALEQSARNRMDYEGISMLVKEHDRLTAQMLREVQSTLNQIGRDTWYEGRGF